eukprot:scaffold98358_cov17-Prasinocladus_malaysianus.AAC.1
MHCGGLCWGRSNPPCRGAVHRLRRVSGGKEAAEVAGSGTSHIGPQQATHCRLTRAGEAPGQVEAKKTYENASREEGN